MIVLQMFLLLCSLSVMADIELVTRIHDIDYGKNGEETLILLESGHVTRSRNKSLLKGWNKKTSWKIILDKSHTIINMQMLAEKTDEQYLSLPETYNPTIVSSGREAKYYFNQSRISRGETQCFNRAHVWAYELWKNHQVKSQKIFLFFSRKYIRDHQFGWWFHVAPLLIVDEWLGGKTEKVVDPRYITAPRSIDWWIGKFVSGDLTCPEIRKYSEYADFPYSEDCYILKAPMYIHQPLDLEMLEVWGIQKNDFIKLDLEIAYKEAFQMDYSGELQ